MTKEVFQSFDELSLDFKLQPFKLLLNQTLVAFFEEIFGMAFGEDSE